MQLAKNFILTEFRCKDKDRTPVPSTYIDNVIELAQNLQVLRDDMAVPVHIHSGYRTEEHNKEVGGAEHSQHLFAKAADIVAPPYGPKAIHAKIERLIAEGKMKQGGLGLYDTFVHYDVRGTKARW